MRAFAPTLASALILSLGAAAPAAAQEEVAPPGNSAITQYKETLPAPGGGRPTDSTRERSPDKVLGSENAERLEQFGPAGEAAAEVAAETAPPKARPEPEPEQQKGGSPLEEIAGQATGAEASGGIGLLLPLLILLAIAAAAGYALSRRRARA
jgi:hypothetical protein